MCYKYYFFLNVWCKVKMLYARVFHVYFSLQSYEGAGKSLVLKENNKLRD
jgi:hypothetical protein